MRSRAALVRRCHWWPAVCGAVCLVALWIVCVYVCVCVGGVVRESMARELLSDCATTSCAATSTREQCRFVLPCPSLLFRCPQLRTELQAAVFERDAERDRAGHTQQQLQALEATLGQLRGSLSSLEPERAELAAEAERLRGAESRVAELEAEVARLGEAEAKVGELQVCVCVRVCVRACVCVCDGGVRVCVCVWSWWWWGLCVGFDCVKHDMRHPAGAGGW